jgi:hypothetical protein
MKIMGIVLLALISTTAYAQQSTPPLPAQTPPGPVLQIVPNDSSASHLDLELGSLRLTNHSGRYTFAYLPFLAPLQGTAFRSSIEMPNALALTGTTIPQRPHTRPRAFAGIR